MSLAHPHLCYVCLVCWSTPHSTNVQLWEPMPPFPGWIMLLSSTDQKQTPWFNNWMLFTVHFHDIPQLQVPCNSYFPCRKPIAFPGTARVPWVMHFSLPSQSHPWTITHLLSTYLSWTFLNVACSLLLPSTIHTEKNAYSSSLSNTAPTRKPS